MDGQILLRAAVPDDAGAILAVYAPYVEKTAITFEYDVPSLEAFTGRIRRTLEKYPYLVAQKGGEILGYAYTGPFVGRAPMTGPRRPPSTCGSTSRRTAWAGNCIPPWRR